MTIFELLDTYNPLGRYNPPTPSLEMMLSLKLVLQI
jgi:hypothetical protein